MRRRDALKSLGALAGVAAIPKVLGACGGDDGDDDGITTIVTVMMENRSYDHYLGARTLLEGRGGDGLAATMSNPRSGGELVSVYHDGILEIPDPPHGWNSCHDQYNAGANDGFLREYEARFGAQITPHVMGYLTRDDLPFTYALADGGAVCDAWFCSMLGPTWPNRMYLHSATSGGLTVNELPEQGGISWPSIHHRLNDAGIPWAYYFQDLPFVPLFKDLEVDGFVKRFHYDFFDDAAAGTLPPVVFVEPAFSVNDDHPPHHPMLGQQFLASVYGALAESPQWKNCLLVITYDEHGGFFDHVPPPTAADDRAGEGFDRLGFRVPTVVAGPYVKQGHVSSVVRDHTSVIAHINRMFDLEPLTARDAAANDLSELIDVERLANLDPLPPPVVPAIEVDEMMVRAALYERQSELVDLELFANQGRIPKRFDNRDRLADAIYGIGDALDRFNRGRIRR
jgi:phospholipase C